MTFRAYRFSFRVSDAAYGLASFKSLKDGSIILELGHLTDREMLYPQICDENHGTVIMYPDPADINQDQRKLNIHWGEIVWMPFDLDASRSGVAIERIRLLDVVISEDHESESKREAFPGE